jgi:hypothetical protein
MASGDRGNAPGGGSHSSVIVSVATLIGYEPLEGNGHAKKVKEASNIRICVAFLIIDVNDKPI